MTTDVNVLVIAEIQQGIITPTSLELVGLAHKLVAQTNGTVNALVYGGDTGDAAHSLIVHGADRVFVRGDQESAGDTAVCFSDLVKLVQDIKPTLIGFSHTAFGADVAPRLAFRLDIAIATDCIAAEIVDEKLLLTRPCFGGKAYEILHCLTMPGIATFKPKSQSFPSRDDSRVGQIITVNSSPDLIDKTVEVVAREIRPHGGQRLKDARVVVGVGRGLKDKKGLDLARELAVTLDGAIGATRAACDIGLCEYTSQIGASGIIIAPDLYIAVGISGAGHHMVGCTSAKKIIAINIDPDAAIFAFSRFGVICDSHEFLPEFIEEVRKLRSQDRAGKHEGGSNVP